MNVQVAVISADNLERHKEWKSYLESLNYKGRGSQIIDFPLIDDQNAKASNLYGMIHPNVSTTKDIRGVFIIDTNNIVRSVNFYPMEVGRNMDEIERLVVALQISDFAKVLLPANWNIGDDFMIPFYPFTTKELTHNPNLRDKYYNLGYNMWFERFGIKPDFSNGKFKTIAYQ